MRDLTDQSHANWIIAYQNMEKEWGFRLYAVRVDTYTVWSQWWSVEECLDLMA